MIEVHSFKDRTGKRVRIGDAIQYFDSRENPIFDGLVRRVSKAGYFVEFYIFGRNYSLNPMYAEKKT